MDTLIDTKTCKNCGVDKPLSDFYKEKIGVQGRRANCKVCHLGKYFPPPQPVISPEQRFSQKIKKTETGCWEWQGEKNERGYGFISLEGKKRPVHRFAAHLYLGLDLADSHRIVMHRCDNPPCCNPAHLQIGTHADNQHDKVSKGRQAKGTSNGRSKLTESDVSDIRVMLSCGRPVADLSRMFEVDGTVIRKIRDGRAWSYKDWLGLLHSGDLN